MVSSRLIFTEGLSKRDRNMKIHIRMFLSLFETDKNDREYLFLGTCAYLNGDDIIDMVDSAEEVQYQEFLDEVGLDEAKRGLSETLGDMVNTHKINGYGTSFWKSSFRGKPCYYVDNSAIEHVFISSP